MSTLPTLPTLSTALRAAFSLGAGFANLVGELVGEARCASCDGSVSGRRVLFCPTCAASVERVDADANNANSDDPNCLAAFEYGGALTTAITRLKYEDRADLAPRLGRAMLGAAGRLYDAAVDLVVPVPLHPRRLAARGYNQAALLASPVARALDVKLASRALTRLRDTPRQTSLDRQMRLKNIHGAFCAREALAKGMLTSSTSRVLLIDDVRTTGSTLAACATALHEVGVREVLALVLARA